MSLPLKRRIARAALLVAAGAAPLVGAGVAQAAPAPSPNEMTGPPLGQAVDDVSRETTRTAGEVGGGLVEKAGPAAGRVVGPLGKKAVRPAEEAQQLASKALPQAPYQQSGPSPMGGLLDGGFSPDSLTGADLPIG
ncbi:ATP-binding protein [Streptomyces buecherae]|uniref:ATP-binding protein n=1 Tax=Streptomyces buecherae TaxID=2763006 RepID=UPI0037B5E248